MAKSAKPFDVEWHKIATSSIFADLQTQKLYTLDKANPQGRRIPHKDGHLGYQRDPWARLKWFETRINDPGFDYRLFRPLDVSKRKDGTYAVIDGAGRWLMAQLIGLQSLPCMVHEGLTREQEAEMFGALGTENYKLKPIDVFLAFLGSGDPLSVAINEAVAPYRIARSGSGTLSCVGALQEIYTAGFANYSAALRLIERTSKVIASTWGGFKGDGQWGGGDKQVSGKHFLPVAMLIEAAGKRLNETALRRILAPDRASIANLDSHVEDNNGKKLKSDVYSVLAAKRLASLYNRAAKAANGDRVVPTDIDNTVIKESMEESRTFGLRVREARSAAKAAAKAAEAKETAEAKKEKEKVE